MKSGKITTVNETSLSTDDVYRAQKPFLDALEAKAKKDGITLLGIADKIGIPRSYISALNSGQRSIGKAQRETVEKFANYLKVPVVQIYLWSEFLRASDFVVLDNKKERLSAIHKTMDEDPLMMGILPSKDVWDKWPEAAKIMITQLYEMLARKLLLEYANAEVPAAKVKKIKHPAKR